MDAVKGENMGEELKLKRINCPNCGAAVTSETCPYCGSRTGIDTADAEFLYQTVSLGIEKNRPMIAYGIMEN